MNISKSAVEKQISSLLSRVSEKSIDEFSCRWHRTSAWGSISTLEDIGLISADRFSELDREIRFRQYASMGLAS
jgi:hypothetical protein